MNFKILSLLILITACGVKGNPSNPQSVPLPSLMENYPDIKIDQPLQEVKLKR